MATVPAITIPPLPSPIDQMLRNFVEEASETFGVDLLSVVLYGSAAEGRLRATSDVNVILILSAFDQMKVDRLREPLRVAHAAIQLTTMFLLREEIALAATAFAQKFADVLRRHVILYGEDLFEHVTIPRSAVITRLRQVLLNQLLRLREAYVLRSLREEQLALIIADIAGPLRSCAATLLELEGRPTRSPKEALTQAATELAAPQREQMLAALSTAREQRQLPAGTAGPVCFWFLTLIQHLHTRATQLT